jgi:hypothetical protein
VSIGQMIFTPKKVDTILSRFSHLLKLIWGGTFESRTNYDPVIKYFDVFEFTFSCLTTGSILFMIHKFHL